MWASHSLSSHPLITRHLSWSKTLDTVNSPVMNCVIAGLIHVQTFLLGTHLRVELLSWIASMCSISEYKAKLFPKLMPQLKPPWPVCMRSERSSARCCQAFSFLPIDCVWNSTSLRFWFAFLPLIVGISLDMTGQIYLLSSEKYLCMFSAHHSIIAGAFIRRVLNIFSILILCLLSFSLSWRYLLKN